MCEWARAESLPLEDQEATFPPVADAGDCSFVDRASDRVRDSKPMDFFFSRADVGGDCLPPTRLSIGHQSSPSEEKAAGGSVVALFREANQAESRATAGLLLCKFRDNFIPQTLTFGASRSSPK